jgi:stearoyl-CoA desaturase (delta-9 desaturase)
MEVRMKSIPFKSIAYKTAVLLVVVVPFIASLIAIRALWMRAIYWPDLVLMAAMYFPTGFGVTVGFHRMASHRSFLTNPVVKFVLLALGCMPLQGNPIEWAATHLKHHAVSDREGDPHSPLEGFWHAHFGWLFGVGVGTADPHVYCRHLLKDPIAVFVSRTFWLWVALGLLIPFAIDGWQGLLWAGLVRIFLQQHITWSVNSVCHCFGKRPFNTNDESRNEWLVGLLTLGDGWHNNHHAFPRSAYHGLRWWQIDLSNYLIWTLERLGLVRDVHRVTPEMIERRSSARVQA